MPKPAPQRPSLKRADIAKRIADARQWRIDNKAYFDAIYGPEKACTCHAEGSPA